MICHKKSYAMKMLQLALALSLLQVDPDNYLHQRLRNWDSQLELHDGDGWELEMLRAVPMVEYPYANRKTMMPLIEDLIRFDRQHDATPPQYNVTAYMLNVQNDGGTDQTATMQELQAAPNNAATGNGNVNVAGATALEHAANAAAAAAVASTNASNMGLPASELDLFLNSEHFQDQRSVWELNLADLRDFGDLTVNNPYAGLPLKDEPYNNTYIDVNLDAFFPSLASSPSTVVVVKEEMTSAGALNDTFPEPADIATIKTEQLDKEEADLMLAEEAACSSSTSAVQPANMQAIKKEAESKEEEEEEEAELTQTAELSPFISQTDLTKEESEIVDVLWKQDVDLGYTLTAPHLVNSANNNGASLPGLVSDDDIEKLKALKEIKLDKPNFEGKDEDDAVADIDDEWAGIPFTVDNETGEYIRLPLDEILNDVLQLAEFGNDSSESNSDSVASTSKAAAAKNNNDNTKSDTDEKDNNNNNNTRDLAYAKSDPKDNGNDEDSNKNSAVTTTDTKTEQSNNTTEGIYTDEFDLPLSEIEVNSLPSPLFDLDDEAREELADFDIMLQSAGAPPPPFHHHHHHHPQRGAGMQGYVGGGTNSAFHRQATGFHHGHHQGRMPLSRGVSMEQRLQDIASFFNPISGMSVVGGVADMPPYPHYPTHPYTYQGAAPQHGQYPPPPPPPPHPHHHSHHAMLHANATLGDICPSQPHYGHNLGSAVSSSMHLTNASHDGDGGAAAAAAAAAGAASNVGAYKMEHDMMYYSNASSDINHTTEGFINSILNDEDLHLMDMNDSFCRMVDVNNSTSNNSSVLGSGATSGHASAGSGSATGSTSNALTMSGAAATNSALAGGMTADLLHSGGGAGAGGDRLDASSDSAVSSMGSERVPSLSDGEWGEGSDSAQDYHQGKYGGPYDYSYNNNNRLNDGSRQPPVAQKKHQMFGKRFLNEQTGLGGASVTGANGTDTGIVPPSGANSLLNTGAAPTIKYEYEPYATVPGLHQGGAGGALSVDGAMGPVLSNKEQQAYELKYGPVGAGAIGGYSIDFAQRPPRTPHEVVQHNHTYTLPQGAGSLPRPQARDKRTAATSSKSSKAINAEEEHLTRDEKRARAMNIPISVGDIINLPMDEFNERLSKYDLTENQLSLIRDIRRRGKNKVAAQNCRKRKLDQILSLEDEVKEVRRRKDQLFAERDSLAVERKRISNKFAALHRHIFQYLRDPEGNLCSTSEYTLQQAADGSIYLLRKSDATNGGGNISNSTSNSSSSSSSTAGVGGILSHNNGVIRQQQQPQTQQHSMLGAATHLQPQQPHHHQHHTQQQQLTHMHPQQTQQQQQRQQQQQQQHSAHTHHHQTLQKD